MFLRSGTFAFVFLLAASAQAEEQVHSPASLTYLRVMDARLAGQGTFTLSTAGSLSYTDNLFDDGSEDLKFTARAAAAAALMDFLTLGMSFGTRANHHETRIPQVSQTVGDPAVFLRGGYRILPMLSAAGGLELLLPTAGDGFGLAWQAVTPRLTTAVGFHAPFGLNAALNAGLLWERSETAFEEPLDPILRYSAHAANTPVFELGLGADYRFALFSILALTPFVETTLQLPFAEVDTAAGTSGLFGGGVRVALGSNDDLALTVGGELAYLRPDIDKAAVPAVPPWAVHMGLAYAFDPFAKAEAEPAKPPPPKEIIKEVVKVKEVAPPTGTIQGVVIDSRSKAPVVNATVEIDGVQASPLTVNGSSGTFQTYPLPANRPYKLKVIARGYRMGEINAMIGADAVRTVTVELVKTDAQQFGEVRGTIKDSSGKPLEASIVVSGVGERVTTDAATGAFRVNVPVGTHSVAVGAKGFRTQKKKIRIRPGDVVILNVDLAR